jgi:hypothetical protein
MSDPTLPRVGTLLHRHFGDFARGSLASRQTHIGTLFGTTRSRAYQSHKANVAHREIIAFAWSSFLNLSRCGSQYTFRFSFIVI